ncbi:hypothetical protein [Nocardiopsis xinjiangensis]|uniref:hypothetical protein n=1 Tax=Nocardiopsis xinjiangensis TaxID=124285 RepID=UPI000344F2E1|nr:hypothetical protein [Nocardiopsis xinjiangensis]
MTSVEELTKKQRRMLEVIEDPERRSYWALRSRRRRAVLALAGATVLGIACFVIALLMSAPWAYLPFAGFVAVSALSVVLSSRVSIASRCTPRQIGLDEYQRAEFDQASLLGHRVTNAALIALLTVASGMGGALLSSDFSASVALAVLLPLVYVTAVCHGCFPACYVAWTRPDEVLDDMDEPAES